MITMPNLSNDQMKLLYAASEGNLLEAERLLSNTIDVTHADNQKRIALHYALVLPVVFDDLTRANKLKIAKILIKKAPETLGLADVSGDTAMHLLAANGWDDLLATLLQEDPQYSLHLFTANNRGELPIHTAIANQRNNIVEQLLQYEPMETIIDGESNTLLHHAAMANNIEALQSLLDGEVIDVMATNSNRQTALDIAKMNHFDALIPLLEPSSSQHRPYPS